MSRRYLADDRAPWSFFLPITLAVVLGVLIADAIRYAIVTVFATPAVAARALPAAPSIPLPTPAASPSASGATGSTPPPAATAASSASTPSVSTAPPSTASAPSQAVASPTAVQPASTHSLERLPGSIGARRDGAERACINGTVAVRADNGWQQELSDDRPVRCEQTAQ